mgnify:CR=1 FL=1
MSFSLILYEHHTPTEVRPLLGTRDPEIIAVLKRLLMERMEDEPAKKVRPRRNTLREVQSDDSRD